ncbi:hypothetical protein KI387_003985, partial [Taxus chinensis]
YILQAVLREDNSVESIEMSRLHALPGNGASASFTSDQRSTAQIPSFGIFKEGSHVQLYPLPCPRLTLQRIKAKQVTDPLNEAVRARLCGNWTADDVQNMEAPTAAAKPIYSTSGSDHGIDSATLSDMRFLEEEECATDFSQVCGSDVERTGVQLSIPFLGEQLCRVLEGMCSPNTKVEAMVAGDVKRALEMAALSMEEERQRESNLRRSVMNRLRKAGYNAGICKSRWEQTNGYPPGDYEFIDVVVDQINDRLIVDVDFRAQFEIARPTAQHAALVKMLPTLFVGSADKLRDIIKIMCDASKKSVKAKGMHLPPWRKYRYVEAKWLGPYKRTTNAVAERDERQLLLVREFSGIASLKGMGWDVGFTHQMELYFAKAVRQANKAAQDKLKRRQQEHASNDILFT